MPTNRDNPNAGTSSAPIDVASLDIGHSTPPDRRRRRVDSTGTTPNSSAPSAKRPRTSEPFRQPYPPPAGAMLGVQKGPVSGRPAAKKLVIKNRRVDSSSQKAEVQKYFDATWTEVEAAVRTVLAGDEIRTPLDRVYRGVEDLCRNNMDKDVYERLRRACEKHLADVVLPAIKAEGGIPGDTRILAAVLSEWKIFNEKSRLIRSTFSYLDRTYLLRQNDCMQINDMMISLFKKAIYSGPDSKLSSGRNIGVGAIDGMCSLVHFDRVKDSRFEPALLRDAVAMLHVFGVYVKWFEGRFVNISSGFLSAFASERLDMSIESYIKDCLRLLDEESARCDGYDFDTTTKRLLLEAARERLVAEHSEKLLDPASFSKLVSGNEISSLNGLYRLLDFADMVDRAKEPWVAYILSAGSSIIKDTSRSDEMVTRLLELKQSLDYAIKDAFGGNEMFEWALREAFSEFMNDRKSQEPDSGPAKIGEMIAKYIDMLLRGGLKALPRALLNGKETQEADADTQAADEEGELDRQLDRAVALFRFVEGKDAFEAFYKRDLARRLLMDRSASHDAERTMLSKLKGECGANFTHNLEQMFKDRAIARDEMDAYTQACSASGYQKPYDLQVMVLSSGSWPSYPDIKVTLPPEMAGPIEKFDAFYKGKHNGRVLNWKHGLSHCVLRARFKKGYKELSVSTLQAVVLLLFNDIDADTPLTYPQLAEATGLSDGDLTRTLQSLACGKLRVLTKHPKGKDIARTDTFTFNAGFWNDRVKIKINQIQMRETKEENEATHKKIVKDRALETQAAIVRIMKSRKELGHAVLVAEVIEMTRKRGPVDAGQIKKQIEHLIDKDFLEREGDSYTYLA